MDVKDVQREAQGIKLDELQIPDSRKTNSLKIEAQQDVYHHQEKLFRIIATGALSIANPLLSSNSEKFEIVALKKFKTSSGSIEHIFWYRGTPCQGMKLSLEFVEANNSSVKSEVTVKTGDSVRFIFTLYQNLKRATYHIIHRSLKGLIQDLENIFESNLKSIAKYQHAWYRRRGLTSGFERAWIFIDRPLSADDNAEHLYRYVKKEHPEINSFYMLKKESKDWLRLEREGFRLIPIGAPEWKAALLEAEAVLSSHMSLASTNPLPFYFTRYVSRKFIFLRHGIGISNRHTWLNRRNVDLMVVSTPWEYEELVEKDTFKFTEIDVKGTGIARYDELFTAATAHYKKDLETILIMPTWRKEFVRFIGIKKGTRSIDTDAFKNSKFFLEWGSFLNNPILEQLGRDHGIRFRLLLHSNLISLLDFLEIPKHFELHEATGDTFQQALLKSRALITDYTSVAFDMAYINRPTLYLQFDKNEFLQIDNGQVRNLDYKNEGFGPVAANNNELINNLSEFLVDGLDPKYVERMNEFFFYKDANSRKRIMDEVLKRVGP